MSIWLSYVIVAAAGFMLVPVRAILVYRLRRDRPVLWKRYGAPRVVQRDAIMRKYPYVGGLRVFKISSLADKALLIGYLLLHFVFFFFATITVFD